MKNFFKKLHCPFVYLVLYIIKTILLPAGAIDLGVLGILALICLAQLVVNLVKLGVNRYFETKDKVISENLFRAKVSEDISKLNGELSALKMVTNNPFQKAIKTRR